MRLNLKQVRMGVEVMKMKQTLEALWNGELAPGQTNGVYDPEMEHLTVLMDRNRAALEQELTPNQKELLKKYIDCSEE